MYYIYSTEAAKIIYEICKAIEYLHSNNIAHRDLKVIFRLMIWFIKKIVIIFLKKNLFCLVWIISELLF